MDVSNSANGIINLASGVLLDGVLAALNSLKPEGGGLGRLIIVNNLSSNITAVLYVLDFLEKPVKPRRKC